jgi:hypothetical protein
MSLDPVKRATFADLVGSATLEGPGSTSVMVVLVEANDHGRDGRYSGGRAEEQAIGQTQTQVSHISGYTIRNPRFQIVI